MITNDKFSMTNSQSQAGWILSGRIENWSLRIGYLLLAATVLLFCGGAFAVSYGIGGCWIATNGWYASMTVSNLTTNGAYQWGFGPNNTLTPQTALLSLTVSSPGYSQSGPNVSNNYQRTIYGVHALRQPYPTTNYNQEVLSGSNVIVPAVLSDYIFSNDTVAANVGAGFYVAATNATVSNPYTSPGGLQGWWPLTNGSGSTANDLSGNGNTGTLGSGVRFITGCAAFTAAAYAPITIANNTNLNDIPISLTAWIYASNVSGSQGIYGSSTSPNGTNIQLVLNGSSLGFIEGTAYGTIAATIWTHVAGTFDGTNAIVYTNGVAAGTNTGTWTPATNYNEAIGYGNGGNGWPFGGNMCWVAVYSKVLTASQVSNIYSSATYTHP
jgi:hypothetical protein